MTIGQHNEHFYECIFCKFLILYLVLVAMCMSECLDAREREERAEALRESVVRVRGN